ncbi:hypothetical protein B0T25DRAFT_350416 [Lasiosphaeria hispida]|uniref:protein-histidine N-methyltransferase n=1 Tax=Lasiosphaeria hispida TaxID=260671 RepID=A0AAJ0H6T5_9PEZI|nr:hypothetical protein B0T25DRAFT_350416 [Lasiosphaeria hispida]
MTGHFFSFAGDDIEDDGSQPIAASATPPPTFPTAATATSASAFPVRGKPLLPPVHHNIGHMISTLPSQIAFSTLAVVLDDGQTIQVPRRELWDVRAQLMAEEEEGENAAQSAPGLGEHDVKTGIYEGGFKSWESSVDMVKVLASENTAQALSRDSCVSIELGCGTALPSLALFQWALAERRESAERSSLVLTLADYNPSVLFLVTLPNFILAWALQERGTNPAIEEAFSDEELDLTPELLHAFKESLSSNNISLSFQSGAWSPGFVELLYSLSIPSGLPGKTKMLVMGAETIYSPFALESFAKTLLLILERQRSDPSNEYAAAIVGAKRLYFGVGGSLDDFTDKMKGLGATVETLREETEGVRRGVVRCQFS